MAKLYKTSTDRLNNNFDSGAELLIEQLEVAESLWSRAVGLLRHSHLAENQALWIRPGNNAHTFFMKFPIDCIFVDKKLEIKKIAKSIPAFRLVGPYWKAYSFFETQAGFAESKNLKVGDQLYVVR